jgi:hypothetical protein
MKTVLLGLIMLVGQLVVADAQPVCPDGGYVYVREAFGDKGASRDLLATPRMTRAPLGNRPLPHE